MDLMEFEINTIQYNGEIAKLTVLVVSINILSIAVLELLAILVGKLIILTKLYDFSKLFNSCFSLDSIR
jgi:hypothetical protein